MGLVKDSRSYVDDNGELYIVGRKDNMIVIGAHNIYPETIENVITANTYIEDCLISKEEDHLICYYTSKIDIDPTTIIKKNKQMILPYELPKEFKRVKSIPKNQGGKKIRHQNGE